MQQKTLSFIQSKPCLTGVIFIQIQDGMNYGKKLDWEADAHQWLAAELARESKLDRILFHCSEFDTNIYIMYKYIIKHTI